VTVPRDRRGATSSDVLVFLATVTFGVALLYPAWSARGFRDLVQRAIGDVEAVASAARTSLETSGSWPTPGPPGEAPPEITQLSGDGQPFGRSEYGMEWTTWSVVDSVEVQVDLVFAPGDAPPPDTGPVRRPVVRTIGGVGVHSRDASLLAELAQHFTGQTWFVLDTTWMLVLPERAEARARAP
jgi:hypothetical protein